MTVLATARRWGAIVPGQVDDVFDRPGSIRPMAVLRILLGPVVVVHLWADLTDAWREVSYLDRFHEPWFAFLPTFPAWVQYGLVHVGVVAALAMAVGWLTRVASVLCAAAVTGNMFLTQTHFRHNRAFLIFLLWAVAFTASGRVLSLDARRTRPHSRSGQPGTSSGNTRAAQNGGIARSTADDSLPTNTGTEGLHSRSGQPGTSSGDTRAAQNGDRAGRLGSLWAVWTMRVLASSVYLASGFSKLIDPDWVGGLVLWDRSVRYQHLVADRVPGPLGDVVVDIVTTRWVHAVTSPPAVAMELFIGLGLWFARTRIAAVWVAVFFHLSIEVAASVEVFSLAAIVALVIWTTPTVRDRTVTAADGRWIRWLDWLGRFDVHSGSNNLTVTDRDGTVHTGRRAGWFVAARLPLTFFVAAPVDAVSRRRHRRPESVLS